MAYKIVITEHAIQDLSEIAEYIAVTLSNPSAAVSLLEDIEKSYDALAQMPYLYEQCRNARLRAMGYRKAVIHKYIMVHRVDEKSQTVYILRFFHGTQDYEKLI